MVNKRYCKKAKDFSSQKKEKHDLEVERLGQAAGAGELEVMCPKRCTDDREPLPSASARLSGQGLDSMM